MSSASSSSNNTTSDDTSFSSSPFVLSHVSCVNIGKRPAGIHTGIGYLDHMLDQLNSHAQVGVSVCVDGTKEDRNRHAHPKERQRTLLRQLGEALGKELQRVSVLSTRPENNTNGSSSTSSISTAHSRFCCPLDEALVECVLQVPSTANDTPTQNIQLAPYGIFPKRGRTTIGQLQTAYIQDFFECLSQSMNISISLRKIRGDNAHHIVESAFKAFSRALRNLLDGVDVNTSTTDCENLQRIYNVPSVTELPPRKASMERTTKETSIGVSLELENYSSTSATTTTNNNDIHIDTSIPFLNSIFSTLATESQVFSSLNIHCRGDLHIDDHHSAEDVSIAFGKVLNTALGNKAGLNRMWMGRSNNIEVVMDLSNRPCLTWTNHLLYSDDDDDDKELLGEEEILSVEMVEHVFDSLVMNAHMTVHIVNHATTNDAEVSLENSILDLARAFGRALRQCVAVDPRRRGATASSKGTLSV